MGNYKTDNPEINNTEVAVKLGDLNRLLSHFEDAKIKEIIFELLKKKSDFDVSIGHHILEKDFVDIVDQIDDIYKDAEAIRRINDAIDEAISK